MVPGKKPWSQSGRGNEVWGGNDLWNMKVLSLEWNSDGVMDDDSGELADSVIDQHWQWQWFIITLLLSQCVSVFLCVIDRCAVVTVPRLPLLCLYLYVCVSMSVFPVCVSLCVSVCLCICVRIFLCDWQMCCGDICQWWQCCGCSCCVCIFLYVWVCLCSLCVCLCVCPVSYTHLTLPTNREV